MQISRISFSSPHILRINYKSSVRGFDFTIPCHEIVVFDPEGFLMELGYESVTNPKVWELVKEGEVLNSAFINCDPIEVG